MFCATRLQILFTNFVIKIIYMNNNDISEFLMGKGVRSTPNRVLVMKELMNAKSPVSLAELEISLDTMDKASIFRVLELFAGKELVHVIEDGSRSLKYELCHSESHHSVEDQHVHFYCEKCDKVYCFEDISVPSIKIPGSYTVKSINYMIKGICPGCADL